MAVNDFSHRLRLKRFAGGYFVVIWLPFLPNENAQSEPKVKPPLSSSSS